MQFAEEIEFPPLFSLFSNDYTNLIIAKLNEMGELRLVYQ